LGNQTKKKGPTRGNQEKFDPDDGRSEKAKAKRTTIKDAKTTLDKQGGTAP